MYSRSITRTNRTLFVLSIDESGSMAGEITYSGLRLSKAEVVTRVANQLIEELIMRAQHYDGIHDYYDISVVGYSGNGVRSIIGDGDWISVSDLNKIKPSTMEVVNQYKNSNGEVMMLHEKINNWFKTDSTGETPMYEALLKIRGLLTKWCSDPSNYYSYPPIIFNITDGESTDCEYTDIANIAKQIKEVRTADGEALLINIHIASNMDEESIIFPTEEQISKHLSLSRSAHSLYLAASEMPESFSSSICAMRGLGEVCGVFKGVCYNSSATELITAINIGSTSIRKI